MEKHFNGKDTLPGKGDFVAAFAATNLGDVSPNTAGPRCIDTGKHFRTNIDRFLTLRYEVTHYPICISRLAM